MKDLIGCCGLDCEKCDARIATVNNDSALREKTARLWAELNNAPILPEHIHCLGCRVDGPKTVFCESICEIRLCARQKGCATCAECNELGRCSTLAAITDSCPEALELLHENR